MFSTFIFNLYQAIQGQHLFRSVGPIRAACLRASQKAVMATSWKVDIIFWRKMWKIHGQKENVYFSFVLLVEILDIFTRLNSF